MAKANNKTQSRLVVRKIDLRIVKLGYRRDEAQANAKPRCRALLLKPMVTLKNRSPLGFRNSRSTVANTKLNRPSPLLDTDVDMSSRRTVLYGIAYNVRKQLPQQLRISANQNRFSRNAAGKNLPRFFCDRFKGVNDITNCACEIYILKPRPADAALNFTCSQNCLERSEYRLNFVTG